MLWIILLLLYVAGRRPHLAFLAGLGLVAAAFLAPGVAGAASDTPPPAGIEAGQDALFSLDAALVAIILGAVIPLLNGLLTKANWSSGVKALLGLALATIAGVITTATTDGGDAVFSQSLLLNTFLSFVAAAATYNNVWKPFGLTSTPNGSGEAKLANVGVK
jgi:hypothetical protein